MSTGRDKKPIAVTKGLVKKLKDTSAIVGHGARYTGPPAQPSQYRQGPDGFFAKITAGGTNGSHYAYSWTALDPTQNWAANADFGSANFSDTTGFAVEISGSTLVPINSIQFLRATPGQDYYTFALAGGAGANYAVVKTTGTTSAMGGSTPGTGTGTLQHLVSGSFADAPGPVTVGFYSVWDRQVAGGTYLVVNQALDGNWFASAAACSAAI